MFSLLNAVVSNLALFRGGGEAGGSGGGGKDKGFQSF